jgi:hypothetical protein
VPDYLINPALPRLGETLNVSGRDCQTMRFTQGLRVWNTLAQSPRFGPAAPVFGDSFARRRMVTPIKQSIDFQFVQPRGQVQAASVDLGLYDLKGRRRRSQYSTFEHLNTRA